MRRCLARGCEKMRKRLLFFLSALVFASLVLSATVCATEDMETEIGEMLGQAAEDALDGVDTVLPDGTFDGDVHQTADTLMEILSAQGVLESLADMMSEAITPALSLLCGIVGLLLISALCRHTCDGFAGSEVGKGAAFLCTAAISAAMLSMQIDGLIRIGKAFDGLGALMGGMIPITGAVWAMGGNITTASAGSAALYGLMAVTERLCAAGVMPICYVMAMSALCSSFSGGALLGGFTGAVKKIYNFCVAAVMTVIVFVLGAQTLIGSAADTAAARGGKLVTQTLIPGIGGAIGDTLRAVAGSVQYVKSVVGVGGVVLVLAICLPPLISLLMTRGVLLLSGGVADMLGCTQESRLLCELGNVYACFLGALSISAVAFCIALGIFVKCTVAVG